MLIRHALLGLLKEQNDYGYRLKQRFDKRVGAVWNLNIGQVYQTLRSLEGLGLIDCTNDEPSQQAGQRHYALNPKGERVLKRWLVRSPTRPHPVRDETLIRLLLLELSHSEDALTHITKQQHTYKRHLSRLLAQKKALPPIEQVVLGAHLGIEAAILHTEAQLKWLEHCRDCIEMRAKKRR